MRSSIDLALMKNEDIDIQPKSPAEALLAFKEHYPKNRLWQLAVDGELYAKIPSAIYKEKGWINYENREPGSLRSFFSGLNIALDKMDDKQISLDLIKKLHCAVTSDVDATRMNRLVPGEIRSYGYQIDLELELCFITIEGLTDLLNKIQNGELSDDPDNKYNGVGIRVRRVGGNVGITPTTFTKVKEKLLSNSEASNEELAKHLISNAKRMTYLAPANEEVETLMQAAIDNYNDHIEDKKNPRDVLQLIGETIQALNRIHPFNDANNRTFVNLLLNRMLLQNGFPPATFYEPNVFEVFGHLVAVLETAMQHTLNVYAGEDIFGFNLHAEMSQAELDQLDSFFPEPKREEKKEEKETEVDNRQQGHHHFTLFQRENVDSAKDKQGSVPADKKTLP